MKPSIPKGTRDFLPRDVVRRNYMFDVIKDVFKRYGYLPIETPAMENMETLSGKYGEEGDRLLFRILNNGDFLSKADEAALEARDSQGLAGSIAKSGLRYDLTVPFARFVVMHRNALDLPFKRYQLQPVWRADRPQRGRYREFYQCDVDVVGSESLVYEAEMVQIFDRVFSKLGLEVNIRVNHRQLLAGLAEVCDIAMDKVTSMTIAIDKWDKIGSEGVHSEMTGRGISAKSTDQVIEILQLNDLQALSERLGSSSSAARGLRQLEEVRSMANDQGLSNTLVIDPKLARGLDYYTGCIFEVECPEYAGGSIGGGGRYDDLTGIFGMPGIPGVGISFGAARIFDALEQLGAFPETLVAAPTILFLPLDEPSLRHSFGLVSHVRDAGIAADLYPEAAKLKKQMKFANGIGVPYVIIVGESERESGSYALKHMSSGEQVDMSIEAIIEKFTAEA